MPGFSLGFVSFLRTQCLLVFGFFGHRDSLVPVRIWYDFAIQFELNTLTTLDT